MTTRKINRKEVSNNSLFRTGVGPVYAGHFHVAANNQKYLRAVTVHYNDSIFEAITHRPVFKESWDAFTSMVGEQSPKEVYFSTGVKVLFLDTSNHIIGRASIAVSTIDRDQLTDIANMARQHHANAIILGQNYPDARITPSPEEKKHAKELLKMANEIKMEIRDQMIISGDGYYSYAENGVKQKLVL